MDSFLTLFDLIGVLARRRYQTAERHFAVLGLNHTEARLLMLLKEAGGESTQEGLSNQLYVDRSNAGRALKRLEQENYVTRCEDPADRRSKIVRLAASGRKMTREIARIRKTVALSLFGELSESQAAAIVKLLKDGIPDLEDAERVTASADS